jgi:putative salt-induced outer membrane protein
MFRTRILVTTALLCSGVVLSLSGPQANAQDPAPPPPPSVVATNPPPQWEKSAALGLTYTDGNSETLLFTASLLAQKEWQRNEIGLGASATYGKSDGEKNNETVRGFAQYNRLLNERLFGYARVEGLHDAIADVDYRFTFSPGVGYYFIKTKLTTLSGEVGPGFIYEKQGGDTSGYFTARLAEKFTRKIGDKSRIWQFVEFLPQVDDFDNYLMNFELGLETELTSTVSLRVTFQDTYDNEPAPGRDKNDIKLITAVAMKF